MQNRFGLKDFILIVMVAAVGVFVWMAMFQRDREWERVTGLGEKINSVERQLARIESSVDELSKRPVVVAGPGSASTAQRDESWAVEGVPIQWQEPWTFSTDPRKQPGYAPGGEFTEIYEAQPAKITPIIQTDVYGRRIVDLVMESLAAYDPQTLRLRGVLAEAWQMDPKGLWLRAKIRDNARFSDGEPVTAEDMRWTFHDYVMNRQIEAERTRSIFDMFKEVRVISERVVEFEFTEAIFSNESNALTLFVLPKHFYSRFEPAQINQSTGLLMGSGPYKLESLDPAKQWAPIAPVVLVRNEQYWGTKSPLAKIRLKAIDQELQRLTEYKNGLADMITPSAPQFVAQQDDPTWTQKNRNLKWVNMKSGRSGIIWNCGLRNGKPTPFGDKRVRQAMTLLLDREKMVRDVWKGVGEVCKGFANPGTLGDDPNAKPWPYDPARGLALLKEAGWEDRDGNRVLEDSNGREFTFEATTFGGGEISERIATFLKDAYAAAGIRVTIRNMDWAVGEPVRQQRDFDAMLMGWGANAPESDPRQIFHSSAIENQGDNFAQWKSIEADQTIDAARLELDTEKRAKLWVQFEKIMHDEQPYTWIRVAPYVRFVKKDIQNVVTYPKGLETWEFWRGGADSKLSGL